jgi:SAM-dependent methyltransferase
MNNEHEKLVLDACCGGRMFWFDQFDDRVVYIDIRQGTRIVDIGTPGTKGRKPIKVNPDFIADFRDLPFEDNTFYHVVFDPPHLQQSAGATGRIGFSYGILTESWRSDLTLGFAECFRVLRPGGTLVFKWSETEIPLREILVLTKQKPLYGHKSGKKATTHWVSFVKEVQ